MVEQRLNAELWVNTFRKGMLARFGHDLRLRLGSFELELRDGKVHGRFDLRSLSVVGAVEHGRVVKAAPSASDKAQIERTTAELLATATHPEARFGGELTPDTPARFRVRGSLELAGRSAPLSAEVEVAENELRTAFELAPSRWGIAPYKAFGGALRLDDRVKIELVVRGDATPLEWAKLSSAVATGPVSR